MIYTTVLDLIDKEISDFAAQNKMLMKDKSSNYSKNIMCNNAYLNGLKRAREIVIATHIRFYDEAEKLKKENRK